MVGWSDLNKCKLNKDENMCDLKYILISMTSRSIHMCLKLFLKKTEGHNLCLARNFDCFSKSEN